MALPRRPRALRVPEGCGDALQGGASGGALPFARGLLDNGGRQRHRGDRRRARHPRRQLVGAPPGAEGPRRRADREALGRARTLTSRQRARRVLSDRRLSDPDPEGRRRHPDRGASRALAVRGALVGRGARTLDRRCHRARGRDHRALIDGSGPDGDRPSRGPGRDLGPFRCRRGGDASRRRPRRRLASPQGRSASRRGAAKSGGRLSGRTASGRSARFAPARRRDGGLRAPRRGPLHHDGHARSRGGDPRGRRRSARRSRSYRGRSLRRCSRAPGSARTSARP